MAVKTIKIKKDSTDDSAPSVSANWVLNVNSKGEFPITEYLLDCFTTDEFVTFVENIEKGEIGDGVIDYLCDDINHTIWHDIKDNLTLEIDMDEFRKWIRWTVEKDKEDHYNG